MKTKIIGNLEWQSEVPEVPDSRFTWEEAKTYPAQPIRYLSVCSGVEAATVAWHHMGWTPVGFSEIEPFPSAVLAHHYPNVRNYGDLSQYDTWDFKPGDIDLIVGGTPCQAFSVAGLRGGLADARGNLALVFCRMVERFRPRWVVWENVPGVLSSGGGRDFGSILGALAECGYGFSYRVLDAQNFGVPQRRRRVFVVGHLGAWEPAAAVLFEPESVRRDSSPRRETRKKTARAVGESAAISSANSGDEESTERKWPAQVAPTLGADFATKLGQNNQHALNGAGLFVPAISLCLNAGAMGCLDVESETYIPVNVTDAHAFDALQSDVIQYGNLSGTLDTDGHTIGVVTKMQVRRLTPTECERLQGFPDGYTAIPWKNKPAEACPDSPRYKAMGNSMAVPVMRWIGERIAQVEKDIQKGAITIALPANAEKKKRSAPKLKLDMQLELNMPDNWNAYNTSEGD